MSFTGTVKVGKSVTPSPTGLLGKKGKSVGSTPLLEERYSQSRFEATIHRLARIGEGGLSSGMVLLAELEGDGVSRLGDDVVGLEQENARTANDNTVVCANRSGGRLRVYNDWSGRRGGERRRGGGGGWRSSTAGHRVGFESNELVSWVEGEDHSLLTMISLTAVYPDWLSVTDIKFGTGEGPIYIISADRYAMVLVSKGLSQFVRRTDNPESKPSGKGRQGVSKVDWVTV